MSESEGPLIQHWLVGVAQAAELPDADRLSIPSDTDAVAAWEVVSMTCGVDADELARRVAEHFRMPRADLDGRDRSAVRLLPARTARQYRAVPVGYSDRQLDVASAEPVSLDAEREIGHLASRSVHFHVATPAEVEAALEEAYPPSDEPTHQVPALLSADLESPHVLVVDDDRDTRLLLRNALQAEGFRVTEAPDGPDALEVLEGPGDVHLVSLDLVMEEMHGMEVLRRIRDQIRTAAIPVVVATGTDDPAVEMEALQEGADDFIVKPVDPPRFVLRVQAVLRRYRAGSEA